MTGTETDYDAWAWLYDRTLGPDYRDRARDLLERGLLGRLSPGARVLDLCCGTGQMMAPMIARGFAATGLDMSEDMLRRAAANAPEAELIQGDARDFRLSAPVAGVVCASASLNHMKDLDELSRVFRAVHAALEEGGAFVFDINHPAQMARHWLGAPAAGEIRRDYAWLITPRYDAATGTGAFRVDMYRRPDGEAAAPALWLAILNRPFMRRLRLRRLAEFAARRPGWAHRGVDYPVHGHDLGGVLARLDAAGFNARMETMSGAGAVDADGAACFICAKRPAAASMEAAE
ncbi:MAG: class I SAM-dependent DNA methyltransferase [Pikeienuella sp.]